jgi:hypothetical protein
VGNEETHGAVGWDGRGWSTVVIDELIREEAAVEEVLTPGVEAGSLSSQWLHQEKDVEVVLLLDVDGDGRPHGGRRQQLGIGGKWKWEQSEGWDSMVVRGSENGAGFLWWHPRAGIRLAQSDRRQPVAGNGSIERGHWWLLTLW